MKLFKSYISQYRIVLLLYAGLPLILIPSHALANTSTDGVWTSFTANEQLTSTHQLNQSKLLQKERNDTIIESSTPSFHANLTQLQEILERAPNIANRAYRQGGVPLYLPHENGSYMHVEVFESQTMEAELAAKYPSIKTYKVFGIDEESLTGHLSMTSRGFRAMLQHEGHRWFIEPEPSNEPVNISKALNTGQNAYQEMPITYQAIQQETTNNFQCGVQHNELQQHTSGVSSTSDHSYDFTSFDSINSESLLNRTPTLEKRNGNTLRTYRLAVAVVGEYSNAVSNGSANKIDTLAAIVTAIDRVNMIYNKDLAIHLQLVSNNDSLIFLNSNTDPFFNSTSGDIARVTAVIDSIIGNANYDIGHLFTTNNGGLAFLGSVCSTEGVKGAGVTGLSADQLESDAFYVDFLAHEIGHQFGANHTFNGTSGFCGGGNRNASTAFEPGSGSTIMAYAGICSGENIQNSSDAYFHAGSLSEILSFVQNSNTGGSCGTTSSTGESLPSVSAGINYHIPANTPFKLTANGTGTNLNYTWEQLDTGSSTAAASELSIDNGNRAIFRSFPGTTNPTRYFPNFESITTGVVSLGEAKPASSRNLNFRVTARSGDYSIADDDSIITVHDNNGAGFELLEPQLGSYQIESELMPIIWNTGGSENSPIDCEQVNILLATDGGQTPSSFNTLANNIDNDGSASVTLPSGLSSNNRLLIECSDNIFYSINNGSFNTLATGTTLFSIRSDNSPASEGRLGQTTNYTYTVERRGNLSSSGSITYTLEGGDNSPANAQDFTNGNDDFNTARTLTFSAGESRKTIQVSVQGDIQFEPDESFKVTLSNPSNGHFISVFSAYSLIKNNDAASNISTGSSGGAFPTPAAILSNNADSDISSNSSTILNLIYFIGLIFILFNKSITKSHQRVTKTFNSKKNLRRTEKALI